MGLNEIINEIQSANHVVTTGHAAPDGDCVGSNVAMYLLLKKLGKKAAIVFEEEIPEQVRFLADSIEISNSSALQEADLVIVLDCGDCKRISVNQSTLIGKKIINIDHHVSNTNFGTVNYIDSSSAAVGEIIYELILALGIPVDTLMAESLFVSISTDTGHFKYSNTTAKTFSIISALMVTGIDLSNLYEKLYCNDTREKIALNAHILSNTEYRSNGKIALAYVTQDMLTEYGGTLDDTENLVGVLRDITGIEIAIFIKEKGTGNYKISLRSKHSVDVAAISTALGGGGHVRAAGYSFIGTLKEAKAIAFAATEKAMDEVKA